MISQRPVVFYSFLDQPNEDPIFLSSLRQVPEFLMTGHPFYEGLELLVETQLEHMLIHFALCYHRVDMILCAVIMSSAFSGHGK